MKYAPLSDLLRQARIKTEIPLMAFSDYSWQDSPDTGRSTLLYIIFYQGGTIDHGTHVSGPVAKSSAEIEHNAECTAGMNLAHFRMLIHELLKKYPDIAPEEAALIILDRKFAIFMAVVNPRIEYIIVRLDN